MTIVICPECGNRGNMSYDVKDGKKHYKVQHSYNQGKEKDKGRISYCYLGKPPIEVTKIEESQAKTTIKS